MLKEYKLFSTSILLQLIVILLRKSFLHGEGNKVGLFIPPVPLQQELLLFL